MKIKKVNAVMKQRHEDGTITKRNYPNINPNASGAGITFAMNALDKLLNATLLGTEVITVADAPVSITNEDANASITFPEDTAVEFINYAQNCTIDAGGEETDPDNYKCIFNEGEQVRINTANTPDYICNSGKRCTITTGFGSDTIINGGEQVSINAVGRIANETSQPDDFTAGTKKHIENSGDYCTIEAAADRIYLKNSGRGTYGELMNISIKANNATIENSDGYCSIKAESANAYCNNTAEHNKITFSESGNVTLENNSDYCTLEASATSVHVINSGNGDSYDRDFLASVISDNATVENSGNYIRTDVIASNGNASITNSGNYVICNTNGTLTSNASYCTISAYQGAERKPKKVTCNGDYNQIYCADGGEIIIVGTNNDAHGGDNSTLQITGSNNTARGTNIIVNQSPAVTRANKANAAYGTNITVNCDYTNISAAGLVLNANNCTTNGNLMYDAVSRNVLGFNDPTGSLTNSGSNNTLNCFKSINSTGSNNTFNFCQNNIDETIYYSAYGRTTDITVSRISGSDIFVFGDSSNGEPVFVRINSSSDEPDYEQYSSLYELLEFEDVTNLIALYDAAYTNYLVVFPNNTAPTNRSNTTVAPSAALFKFTASVRSLNWKYHDGNTVNTFNIT